ncbi:response regulator transcription factor [Candidiatus Paracoxiella cheracis]|uniref:response regulator transcription factor n=1 Tax=Candidiatus Paracoxiella cheracis TaxID=3405120 RepID=UPI003BF56909
MSIPNWMKELTRWQSASKTPLGIHTRRPKDPVHRESAYGKRYYFQIDANQIYFTQREMEVALLLLQGLTYKGIGEVLGITGRTIECYITHLRTKLNCSNKKALIVCLRRLDVYGICCEMGQGGFLGGR